MTSLLQQRTNLVNKELQQKLLQILGLGVGAGVAARGTQGVYNLFRRPTTPVDNAPLALKVPVQDEEKQASFLGGDYATTWTGHPAAIPGAIAAAAGGSIGGWKLTDYLLDSRRKQQLRARLRKTKDEYERALLSEYAGKQSSETSELGRDLDELYDELEKRAEDPSLTPGDYAGQAAGTAIAGAGGLAIAAGLITHNLVNKRRQQEVLRKALAQRRRQKAMAGPSSVFITPTSVSGNSGLSR